MRTEINQHLLIVNQIYTLYFAGITALFAAAVSKEGHRYLLLLIPFLSLGVANMIGTHERVIGSIAAYCVQELDPAFKRNGSHIVQWDNSDILKQLKENHYESNRAGGLTLIALPGTGALLISLVLKLYSQKGWEYAKCAQIRHNAKSPEKTKIFSFYLGNASGRILAEARFGPFIARLAYLYRQ
jgi:hypothetical protein